MLRVGAPGARGHAGGGSLLLGDLCQLLAQQLLQAILLLREHRRDAQCERHWGKALRINGQAGLHVWVPNATAHRGVGKRSRESNIYIIIGAKATAYGRPLRAGVSMRVIVRV